MKEQQEEGHLKLLEEQQQKTIKINELTDQLVEFDARLFPQQRNKSLSNLNIERQGTIEQNLREEMRYKGKGRNYRSLTDSVVSIKTKQTKMSKRKRNKRKPKFKMKPLKLKNLRKLTRNLSQDSISITRNNATKRREIT